jgi:predicted nucleic acid-binding protein
VQPSDPDYSLVASALEALVEQGAVLCYTSQNLAEFWNACTRLVDRNGYGLSPAETDLRARAFESRLHLLADSLSVHQEWRQLLVAHGVAGIQVHDARLVAAMRVHGVKRVLTFNQRDFARYDEIEAVHPRNVSASHP